MTDGQNSGADPLPIITEMNKDGDARLFTYNFGNEATDDMLKKAACQNNGVYQKIPDGGNLKLAMASYVRRKKQYFYFSVCGAKYMYTGR